MTQHSEIVAVVGTPTPLPKRPTLYACIRYSRNQDEWTVRVLSSMPLPPSYKDEYPGSVIAVIPGEDSAPTPPPQGLVKELREMASDVRYDIQGVVRARLLSAADEIERLTEELARAREGKA